MTECQNCGARAQLYLCPDCTTALRDMLTELPRWITHLTESAVGHAKLGESARYQRTTPEALDGDAELGEEYDPALLARFLRVGGVNVRASSLLTYVQNTLTTWVRHLCEQRGIEWMHIVEPGFIGPLLPGWLRPRAKPRSADLAFWLAWHVDAIAADEGAGQCYGEIDRHIKQIERIIDRPPPMQFCGPCPGLVDVDHREVPCETELRAPAGATMVRCPRCRAEHDVEALQNQLWLKLADKLMSYPEIVSVCVRTGEAVPARRTIYDWRDKGRLKVRGYLRQDRRRIGPTRHSDADQPVYRLADVRRLMAEKPERKVKV